MPQRKRKNLCALCGGALEERQVAVYWEKPDGTPACVKDMGAGGGGETEDLEAISKP